MEIGDNLAFNATAHEIPGMRAFDFPTHPNASSAQDAAVVVNHKPVVGSVHGGLRIAIGIVNVGYVQLLRHGLQLTVAVGNADRANVIALRKQQFDNALAVALQTFGVGSDLHAFLHLGHAGGQQPVGTRYFDQAQTACAHGREPF